MIAGGVSQVQRVIVQLLMPNKLLPAWTGFLSGLNVCAYLTASKHLCTKGCTAKASLASDKISRSSSLLRKKNLVGGIEMQKHS